MSKTVIQVHMICRDIAGQMHQRWCDLVTNEDVYWEDVLVDLQTVNRVAYPQLELLSCKMKDLKTLQEFAHQWVELPEQPVDPFGHSGMSIIPLSELQAMAQREASPYL